MTPAPETEPGAETAIPRELTELVTATVGGAVKEVVAQLVPQLGELIRGEVRAGLLQAANTVSGAPADNGASNTPTAPAAGGQRMDLGQMLQLMMMRNLQGGGDGIGPMQKQIEQVSGVVNTLFGSIVNPLDEMAHRAEMRAYRSMEILSRVGLTPSGIKEMEDRNKPANQGGGAASKSTEQYVAEAVK